MISMADERKLGGARSEIIFEMEFFASFFRIKFFDFFGGTPKVEVISGRLTD